MSAKQKMKFIKQLLSLNPALTVSEAGRRLNLARDYMIFKEMTAR